VNSVVKRSFGILGMYSDQRPLHAPKVDWSPHSIRPLKSAHETMQDYQALSDTLVPLAAA
jgi:hypothetical protein